MRFLKLLEHLPVLAWLGSAHVAKEPDHVHETIVLSSLNTDS